MWSREGRVESPTATVGGWRAPLPADHPMPPTPLRVRHHELSCGEHTSHHSPGDDGRVCVCRTGGSGEGGSGDSWAASSYTSMPRHGRPTDRGIRTRRGDGWGKPRPVQSHTCTERQRGPCPASQRKGGGRQPMHGGAGGGQVMGVAAAVGRWWCVQVSGSQHPPHHKHQAPSLQPRPPLLAPLCRGGRGGCPAGAGRTHPRRRGG